MLSFNNRKWSFLTGNYNFIIQQIKFLPDLQFCHELVTGQDCFFLNRLTRIASQQVRTATRAARCAMRI